MNEVFQFRMFASLDLERQVWTSIKAEDYGQYAFPQSPSLSLSGNRAVVVGNTYMYTVPDTDCCVYARPMYYE